MANKKRSIISQVMNETNQGHGTRIPLIKALEDYYKKRIVVFQTSFSFDNGLIEDQDATMIEEVLLSSEIKRNLLLVINSPGGFGLAAERIVRVCRKYSSNNYEVLIPHMAKSAATLVALGAKRIWMGKTSELGPVDPQLIIKRRRIAVHNIVSSYDKLIEAAINTKGRIDPYLQQLQVYDPRYIAQLRKEIELSKDMAIKLFETGMLRGKSKSYIEKKIEVLINPDITLEHGRPIYFEQARNCGMTIGVIKANDEIWKTIWELQLRYDHCLTSGGCGKMIESVNDSFLVRGIYFDEAKTDEKK